MGRRTGSESGRCCQRCTVMGEKESPPAASAAPQTSSSLAAKKPAGPGALRQGFGLGSESRPCAGSPSATADGIRHRCGSRAGKGSGPLVSPLAWTEWPGGGNWTRHKRGTEKGPPRSQKRETVPEKQPLPGLFSP